MKFKHAESDGWYYKISDSGEKSPSWTKKNKPGYYRVMMEWVAEGNNIEPRFTAEELAEKEAADKIAALESQNQTISKLLDESDKKSSAEYRNSIEDKEKWKLYGDKLIIILKSGIIQELPSKPF